MCNTIVTGVASGVEEAAALAATLGAATLDAAICAAVACVPPGARFTVCGEIENDSTADAFVTLTVAEPDAEEPFAVAVAVMPAVPTLMPVTLPVASTDATVASDDFHATVATAPES